MDGRLALGSQGLAADLTRFFGREAEIAELREAVERSRLMTLVGAPGCGKTRLAMEAGALLGDRFRDGARVVELASIGHASSIAHAVGTALGVTEEPGRPMVETVVERLASAELLVVVDNCEHLVDGVAGLVGRVLAASPAVHVLATSRVALGLPGERVWRVPPLDEVSAVELFADRAGLAGGGFEIDDGNRPLVADICQRLAGLPLAIELAAAWTRVLSASQVLDRLDDALALLRSEARGVVARQRTMEATIDWSYQLLEPGEQRLFDRLSVFAGGFDLAAAQAAAGPDDDTDVDGAGSGSTEGHVLGGLTSLVDHSLVLATCPADTTEPMRYRLLEPVRQCGATKLAARGETDTIRRRHGQHYLTVASRSNGELHGSQRGEALHRLKQEEPNLLAALDWATSHDPELGLRLGVVLRSFWELHGRVNDGRLWLDGLLDHHVADRRLRATALSSAARLAWQQWDHPRARALLEESMAIARELGDELAVARRLRTLALVAMGEDDTTAAAQLCEESLAIFRHHDDTHGALWATIYLGWIRYTAGDFDGAIHHMHEALAISRPAGNVAATIEALRGLAYGANRTGDRPAQRAHLVEALTLLQETGGVTADPYWLMPGSELAATEGRTAAAFRLAGALEAVAHRGGALIPEQFFPPFEAYLRRARRKITRTREEQLRAEGARMTPQQLLVEAMAEPESDANRVLSGREQEVADLVGQGLTNVQIAEKLFISKRTVESHVDHIKQKLGFRTRPQVMAWALHDSPDRDGG